MRRLANPAFLERIDVRRQEWLAQREAERAAFTGDCFECRDDPVRECEHCERGRAKIQARYDEYERESIRHTIEYSGLPKRFHHLTFETYPGRQSAEVRSFVDAWDGERNLLLVGKYGVGKTGLIAAAIAAVAPRIKRHMSNAIWFVSTVGLTDQLRAGYSDGSFTETMQKAQTVPLLILDDLGAEKASEWVQERLFAIIDRRYGERLPVWATSNLGPDRLAEQIGERVFWRLMEDGDLIQITGPNLREAAR